MDAYCAIYGEAHRCHWVHMIIELKKYYQHNERTVDEGDEEVTIPILTKYINHLLHQSLTIIKN